MNHDDLVKEFEKLRDHVTALDETITDLKRALEEGAYNKPQE